MVLAVRLEMREIVRKYADLTGTREHRKVIILAADISAGITKVQTLF